VLARPGTGIAPFRAFLQERQATNASGRNWLFFGHQRSDYDFFYKDDLLAMRSSGLLTRLTLAWSRDGAFLLGTRQDGFGGVGGLSRYWIAGGRYESVYDSPGASWFFPVTLADGKRAVVRDRDGIFLLDLQTKKARRLLDVQGQFVGKSVGVTKDERFVTFTETAAEGNIWLANFRH